MAVALGSPDTVSSIVAVDNAPVDAALDGNFPKYIRGMKKIQNANVTRLAEADAILQEFEPVRSCTCGPATLPRDTTYLYLDVASFG